MTKVLLGFAASALLTACGGLASTTSDSREGSPSWRSGAQARASRADA
jgi:hypothetical protein